MGQEATQIDAMWNELCDDSEPPNVSRHIRITGDDAGCRPSARHKLFRRDLARVTRVDTEAVRDAQALSSKAGDLRGRMSEVAVDADNRATRQAARNERRLVGRRPRGEDLDAAQEPLMVRLRVACLA